MKKIYGRIALVARAIETLKFFIWEIPFVRFRLAAVDAVDITIKSKVNLPPKNNPCAVTDSVVSGLINKK